MSYQPLTNPSTSPDSTSHLTQNITKQEITVARCFFQVEPWTYSCSQREDLIWVKRERRMGGLMGCSEEDGVEEESGAQALSRHQSTAASREQHVDVGAGAL